MPLCVFDSNNDDEYDLEYSLDGVGLRRADALAAHFEGLGFARKHSKAWEQSAFVALRLGDDALIIEDSRRDYRWSFPALSIKLNDDYILVLSTWDAGRGALEGLLNHLAASGALTLEGMKRRRRWVGRLDAVREVCRAFANAGWTPGKSEDPEDGKYAFHMNSRELQFCYNWHECQVYFFTEDGEAAVNFGVEKLFWPCLSWLLWEYLPDFAPERPGYMPAV